MLALKSLKRLNYTLIRQQKQKELPIYLKPTQIFRNATDMPRQHKL